MHVSSICLSVTVIIIDQHKIFSVSAIVSAWEMAAFKLLCNLFPIIDIEEPTSSTLMSTSLPSTTEHNMQPTTSSEAVNPHQQTTTSTIMTESPTTTLAESSQAIALDEASSFSTYSFATTSYSFNGSPNQQNNILRDQAAGANSMRNRRTVIATTVSIGGLSLSIVILILTVVIVAVVVKYRQQNRLLNFKIKKNEHQHIGLGKLHINCEIPLTCI